MRQEDQPYPEQRFETFVYGAGPDWDDPAETYHEASKTYRVTAPALRGPSAAVMDVVEDPDAFLGRAGVARRGPLLALPTPRSLSMPLGRALECRRSERAFAPRPLGMSDVSTLLWAAYGRGAVPGGRPCPSGGALYPLEIWLVAEHVAGLAGLYHYEPDEHALTGIDASEDAFTERLALPELVTGTAAWVIVSAAFWRSRFKYGQRGYRHVLLEAGHAMQNLLLTAVALGLGAVSLSGFFDDEVDRLIGADGVNESSVYAAALGALP